MQQYHDLLKHILDKGETTEDRTGVGTISIFGTQARYDLSHGFPAVTTKKLSWKPVVAELLWFLEGSTNERRLAEIQYQKPRQELKDKTTIWTANANAQGVALGYQNDDVVKELGPVYGYQWRHFGGSHWARDTDDTGVDQIKNLIDGIISDPHGRRHILNAWNPIHISAMALPPCHALVQFNVSSKNKLNCQLYQRSVDAPLGLPFNIASYALLTHMVAQITGLEVGEFIHTGGDVHIYLNQIDGVKEQLTREPYSLPALKMPEFSTLEELLQTTPDEYKLIDYKSHSAIKFPFAV